MQRSPVKYTHRQILQHHRNQVQQAVVKAPKPQRYDVFINHRGIDTKRSVAGMIHDHLTRELRLRVFLDCKNMKPGDRLFDHLDPAVRSCRIGMAVFSPRYCDSYFCLHELSLMMESGRRVIPVFCDVKPSELRVKHDPGRPAAELQRFGWALEEAKYTVGLTFDSSKRDWAEFLRNTSDAVMKNLVEVERHDHE